MKVPREQLWVGKWVVDFVLSPHNDYASGLASRSRTMDRLLSTQAIRLISPFRFRSWPLMSTLPRCPRSQPAAAYSAESRNDEPDSSMTLLRKRESKPIQAVPIQSEIVDSTLSYSWFHVVLTVPTRLGSATVRTGAVRLGHNASKPVLVCRLLSVHGNVPEAITITGVSEKVLRFCGIIF